MSATPGPEPRISRPAMVPGYGLPTELPDHIPPWPKVESELEGARNYWVCTVSPGGRAHAMPVWGVWFDGALLFSTDPESRKARNIAANPEVVIHLESGDDVVILEGRLEGTQATALPVAVFDAYEKKYGIRPDETDANGGWYRLALKKALTWEEKDFVNSALRRQW
ncbi:MAG: pyridoxamine 5'-phosphate oxidase family protein [Dehalococcoidia bacterium]